MSLEVQEAGGLEGVGDGESDSMFIGWSSREERAEIDDLKSNELYWGLIHKDTRGLYRYDQVVFLDGCGSRVDL